MPTPRGPTPYRDTYAPLIALLAATEADAISLTLSEIESVIGCRLSVTAQVTLHVWHGTRHRYVRDWQAMGWKARFSQRERRVTWRRRMDDSSIESMVSARRCRTTSRP